MMNTKDAELGIEVLLTHLGYDIKSEGLRDTPKRYVKAIKEFLTPTEFTPTTFDSEEYGGGIVVESIPFYSLCEHHILPFFGEVSICYHPNTKILGLSKLPRTVDKFARRLQNQERMTKQIAEFINQHCEPKGIAVVAKARHFCMEMRGIKKQFATRTETLIINDESVREDLLCFIDTAGKF